MFHSAIAQMRTILLDLPLKDQIVIDATAGNGKDTLFLAQTVGCEGKVYAFDIQQQALANTRNLLEQHHITWYQLINDSHENIEKYHIDQPAAIVFNLGYLPGGNHAITTQAHSTLIAVKKSLSMLKVGGILTIIVYPGHESGKQEDKLLKEYFAGLPRAFDVLHISMLNCIKNPPYLIAIRKLREVNYEG